MYIHSVKSLKYLEEYIHSVIFYLLVVKLIMNKVNFNDDSKNNKSFF